MVALDPYNPRSIAFQVGQIQAHLAELPPLRQDGMMEEPRRIITGLAAEMATREAASLDAPALLAVEQALMSLAVAVEARYVYHGPQGARPEKLTGLA
jgi:uncharacterized alpha-E superfamily protein